MDEKEMNRGGTADLVGGSEPEYSSRSGEYADTEQQSMRAGGDTMPLLKDEQARRYEERWEDCQRGFVDEPRRSVEEADELVADLMKQIASEFADERSRLEEQWDRGEDVSTEDLRVALQRYRSFFHRLLSI
jgi:hypothetical protein